jgi:hypothetical protein
VLDFYTNIFWPMYPLVQRLRGVAWCSKQTRQFWRSSCCELLNHPHDFEGGVCSTQCSFCLLDLYVQKIHDRYLYILSTSIDIWWYLFFYTYLYNPIYIYIYLSVYLSVYMLHFDHIFTESSRRSIGYCSFTGRGDLRPRRCWWVVGDRLVGEIFYWSDS